MAEDNMVDEAGAKPEEKSNVVAEGSQQTQYRHIRPGVGIGFAVVFILLLGMAFAVGYHVQFNRENASKRIAVGALSMSDGARGGLTNGYGHGMMRGDLNVTSGTTNTRVSGVVTAVNGDTITVAGSGTTTKVSVSTNTTYSGSSQPAKVNDTIVAVGAKNADGTLVASDIYLSRQ